MAIKLNRNDQNVIEISHASEFGTFHSTLPLGSTESTVFVEAAGGAGGAGGRGGDGHAGRNGSNGLHATRKRVGGTGQDGGDGGDSGCGGHGGNGGCGASITLRVSENDMDLLMLLKSIPNVGKGLGGLAGLGGMPGRGGRGGKRGRSYSWTETRGDETYHYINPAGKDGRNGRIGRNGAKGRTGRDGHDGLFCILVAPNELDETINYIETPRRDEQLPNWRYDLVITGDVDVRDRRGYGVLEPGAECAVSYTMRNVGGTSTPSEQDVFISLYDTPEIVFDIEHSVKLPRSITPNSSICTSFEITMNTTFIPPVRFKPLDITRPVIGSPMKITSPLRHRATVSRVNQVCFHSI